METSAVNRSRPSASAMAAAASWYVMALMRATTWPVRSYRGCDLALAAGASLVACPGLCRIGDDLASRPAARPAGGPGWRQRPLLISAHQLAASSISSSSTAATTPSALRSNSLTSMRPKAGPPSAVPSLSLLPGRALSARSRCRGCPRAGRAVRRAGLAVPWPVPADAPDHFPADLWCRVGAPMSLFHPGYASRTCNTWMALAS
jgi:hypothetical protein